MGNQAAPRGAPARPARSLDSGAGGPLSLTPGPEPRGKHLGQGATTATEKHLHLSHANRETKAGGSPGPLRRASGHQPLS